MKTIKHFLDYVEIKTKLASVLPFLVGAGYTFYHCGSLDIGKTLIFFAAMLLFDMTATAINNHVGTRQQGKKNHYRDSVSIAIILTMLTGAAALGIYLTLNTDLVVLLTGILCFGVGILYSFGPLPIARTPFGEILSGGVMGICIPFLVYQINHPGIISLMLEFPAVTVSVELIEAISLGIAVMPLVLCISNIMLANNICDVEEDILVKRYTLPFYIGKKKALFLFRWLYIGAWFFMLAGCVGRILPVTALLGLAGIIPAIRNIRIFEERQDKKQTFSIAIKNFLLLMGPYAVGIWLATARYLWK